jgi:dGTPase
VAVVGRTSSERIDRMVTAVIQGSGDGRVGIDEEVRAAIVALRRFLFTSVYPHESINSEIVKAKKIMRELYILVKQQPERFITEDAEGSRERRVADFLAGMTDSFALRLYRENFFPESDGA